eukprot:11178671-Lingulodinium_polyedra.AAC.1
MLFSSSLTAEGIIFFTSPKRHSGSLAHARKSNKSRLLESISNADTTVQSPLAVSQRQSRRPRTQLGGAAKCPRTKRCP